MKIKGHISGVTSLLPPVPEFWDLNYIRSPDFCSVVPHDPWCTHNNFFQKNSWGLERPLINEEHRLTFQRCAVTFPARPWCFTACICWASALIQMLNVSHSHKRCQQSLAPKIPMTQMMSTCNDWAKTDDHDITEPMLTIPHVCQPQYNCQKSSMESIRVTERGVTYRWLWADTALNFWDISPASSFYLLLLLLLIMQSSCVRTLTWQQKSKENFGFCPFAFKSGFQWLNWLLDIPGECFYLQSPPRHPDMAPAGKTSWG